MNERDILASTYFHTITEQKRQVKTVTEFGETISEIKVIGNGIKCSLSKNSLAMMNNTKGIQTVSNTFTLFCSDLIDIKAGDIITIDNKEYVCQEPFIYEGSHMEALLEFNRRV